MIATAQNSIWLRKLPLTRLQALGYVLLIYFLSYIALMNRRAPAIDQGKGLLWISFQSSFRFAPVRYGFPTSTDWNLLYSPLDKLYFGLFPGQRKYGDWKDVEHNFPY